LNQFWSGADREFKPHFSDPNKILTNRNYIFQEKHLSSFEILQAFLQVEKLICNHRFIAGVSAPVKEGIFCLLETKRNRNKEKRLSLSRI